MKTGTTRRERLLNLSYQEDTRKYITIEYWKDGVRTEKRIPESRFSFYKENFSGVKKLKKSK